MVERDSCQFAQIGVYEESREQVYVCTEEGCGVHKGKTKYASPEEKASKKKEQRGQREETEYRLSVLAAVKDRVPKTPQKAELYAIAVRFLSQMTHESRVAVFKVFKWLEAKSAGERGGRHVNYVELGEQRLAKLGTYELLQFLLVGSLAPDVVIPYNDPDQTLPSNSALAETARRLKVDLRALRSSSRKAGKKAKAS